MQIDRYQKRDSVLILLFSISIGVTALIVERIKKITGSSLVSDEGVFLAYAHYLAGRNISGVELDHLNGYGPFYWVQCLLLVFPASILNRLGIPGLESLRLIVWACGLVVFLYLITLARLANRSQIQFVILFFCLFPIGNMVRFFGIKDMVTAATLLLVSVLVQHEIANQSYKIKPSRSMIKIISLCMVLFFIQNNFILIFVVTMLVVAILKRSFFLAITAFILSLNFVVFTFIFRTLQQVNSEERTALLPTNRITTIEATKGGAFIPENNFHLPHDIVINLPKEIVINLPQAVSIENSKIFHLFYFNLSSLLSGLATIEGIAWLIAATILLMRILHQKEFLADRLFVLTLPVVSFFGILVYDENFGTFLRHRSSLLPIFLYAILSTQSFTFKYGKFAFLPRGHRLYRRV